jgi:hypothetical protein
MPTRREVLGGAAVAAATFALAGCGGGTSAYDEVVAETWATLRADADLPELLRYATLAANSHNTQPWRFQATDGMVSILPDLARRTPAVDPDDHHLFTSLGCAAENFAIAALARGKVAAIAFDAAGEGRIDVDLTPVAAAEDELFAAIPARQCTRSDYDGRAIPQADLDRLAAAARMEGVEITLLTERARIDTVLDHVIAGNTAQIEDPAFVAELKAWIRFSQSQALATRDGLYSATSGNPTLPAWLGSMLFGFVFTASSENDRYASQLRSTPAVAVFTADRQDTASWVALGRSYQRFALRATALGIRQAFVNQPVEVPAVREQFSAWLGLGERRADLIVRLGYAPPMPKSLRRPVSELMA